MFTSSSSNSSMLLRPPPGIQQHNSKPKPTIQQFILKKLSILAVLAILVQGCTNSAASSSDSSSPPREEIDRIGQATNDTPANLSTPLIQPTATQDVIETSTPAQVLAVRNDPDSTSFSLPEPTFTLEPTPIPTAVVDIPTAAPLPSPTATSLPSATVVPPTSTPILLPIATSLPVITSQSGIEHVVVISIDGLRPDALDIADTPILDDLRTRGSYFPNAQTIKQSWTLPSHASMLSGMLPEKHGLLWSLPYIGWPGLEGPTLFNVAHDAGYSTAMVFGKEKLNYLVLGDSVDNLFGQDVHDTEVKDKAVEFIEAGLPDILFIHFPDVDRVGHALGWMSENQIYSVNFVDGMIGEVVAALERGGYMNSTLLIVTADHGGRDKSHGDDAPLDRTIPWLAVGPNVPANVIQGRAINTYDTAATVLYALEVPIPEKWDGQPVMEIFP